MTLEKLLACELELRECLLREAREDDDLAARCIKGGLSFQREYGPGDKYHDIAEGQQWRVFTALDELRVLEHRLYKIREAIKQAEEDARVAK